MVDFFFRFFPWCISDEVHTLIDTRFSLFRQLLENIKRLDNIESIVELVDAKADIKIFVQANKGEELEIPKRDFVKPEDFSSEVSFPVFE